MNKLNTAIILLLITFSANSVACNQVASGYKDKHIMYVVCANLPYLSNDNASKLVRNIMRQYVGPPDEVLVYFVASAEFIGKPEDALNETELVGYYYTHDHKLVIWPQSHSRKQEVELTW